MIGGFKKLDTYIKIYLVGSSIGFILCLGLLIIRFIFNLYIIDPYYLICGLIISLGLFLTVIVSLREEKKINK